MSDDAEESPTPPSGADNNAAMQASVMQAMFAQFTAKLTANLGVMITEAVDKKYEGTNRVFFFPFIAINQQSKLIYFLLFVLTDRAAPADKAEEDDSSASENGIIRRDSRKKRRRGSLLCKDVALQRL